MLTCAHTGGQWRWVSLGVECFPSVWREGGIPGRWHQAEGPGQSVPRVVGADAEAETAQQSSPFLALSSLPVTPTPPPFSALFNLINYEALYEIYSPLEEAHSYLG